MFIHRIQVTQYSLTIAVSNVFVFGYGQKQTNVKKTLIGYRLYSLPPIPSLSLHSPTACFYHTCFAVGMSVSSPVNIRIAIEVAVEVLWKE